MMKFVIFYLFQFCVFFCSIGIFGQDFKIKGKIIDNTTGKSVSGVQVTIATLTVNDLTDSEGKFVLKISQSQRGKDLKLIATKKDYKNYDRNVIGGDEFYEIKLSKISSPQPKVEAKENKPKKNVLPPPPLEKPTEFLTLSKDTIIHKIKKTSLGELDIKVLKNNWNKYDLAKLFLILRNETTNKTEQYILDNYYLYYSVNKNKLSDFEKQLLYRIEELHPPKTTVFEIKTFTGTKEDAGTDETINIEIVGTNGIIAEVNLDNPEPYDDREKGRTDIYLRDCNRYVGKVEKLLFKMSGSSKYFHDTKKLDDWFLEKISFSESTHINPEKNKNIKEKVIGIWIGDDYGKSWYEVRL